MNHALMQALCMNHGARQAKQYSSVGRTPDADERRVRVHTVPLSWGGFVTGQRHHRRATLAAAGTRGPSEKRPGGVVVELALPVAVRRGRVTYSSSTRVSTS